MLFASSNICAITKILAIAGGKARVFNENGNSSIELPKGKYVIQMQICADGKTIVNYQRFVISNTAPFIKWINEKRRYPIRPSQLLTEFSYADQAPMLFIT
jgi:hypothetical protein